MSPFNIYPFAWSIKIFFNVLWICYMLSTHHRNTSHTIITKIRTHIKECKNYVINLPSLRIDSNGIWFSSHVGQQSCAVGAIHLPDIDRIPQTCPVSGVITEPVHSRMVSPIYISSNPVNCNISGPFKFRTLKEKHITVV